MKESEIKASADAAIKGILDDAFAKYREGEKKHGVLDIDNDPRNFLLEAERELLDKVVYSCIEIARLREINKKLNALGLSLTNMAITVHALDVAAVKEAVEKEIVPKVKTLINEPHKPSAHEEPTL